MPYPHAIGAELTAAQIVLGILGTGAAATALGALVTGLFLRKRTAAEAREKTATAGKVDAEASGSYIDQISQLLKDVREQVAELRDTQASLNDCRRDVATRDIKIMELEADNRHLRDANDMLGKENTRWQEEVTNMREQLRAAAR